MTRSIAEIHGLLQEAQTAIHRLATKRRSETQPPEDHVWAAITLATTAATCESILAGRPVLTDNLEPNQLRHALRGAPTPPPGTYTTIDPSMLDAIVEAGPLPDTWADLPEHIRPEAPATPPIVETPTQPPRINPPRTWIPR